MIFKYLRLLKLSEPRMQNNCLEYWNLSHFEYSFRPAADKHQSID